MRKRVLCGLTKLLTVGDGFFFFLNDTILMIRKKLEVHALDLTQRKIWIYGCDGFGIIVCL